MILHLALISNTRRLAMAELSSVAAALDKQVQRDFGPIWGITGTINAFASASEVPADYCPIFVEDAGSMSQPGIHLDADFGPCARVAYSNAWSLVASHEALEMLADPFCSRTKPGPHPTQPGLRVEYLVEVCDPAQSPDNAYLVNGYLVSDFVTPHYYEPDQLATVKYSFGGKITAPRQVLPGGYLAFRDPTTDQWMQLTLKSGNPRISSIDVARLTGMALRVRVDRVSPARHWTERGLPATHAMLRKSSQVRAAAARASLARAAAWRRVLANGEGGKPSKRRARS